MSKRRKIHFTVPIAWALLPLAAGIALHGTPRLLVLILTILAVIGVICHFTCLRDNMRMQWLLPVSLCLAMFAAGTTLYQMRASASLWNGVQEKCRITITSEAVKHTSTLGYDAEAGGQKVKIYMASDSVITPGTSLWVRTQWNPTHDTQQTETFDYMHYLFLQGYSATAYIAADAYMTSSTPSQLTLLQQLKVFASTLRQKAITIYRKAGVGGDALAVLSALTLGSREDITPQIRQNYVRAGAMHVLAVSGLHVGVICLILTRLLFLFGISRSGRIVRALVIVAALTVYAFITGLTPSVVRAAVMFGIMMAAGLLQKKHCLLNTLCFTAFATLLIDPMALYSVSFQLSYSATASIIAVLPWLRQHEPENRWRRWLYYAMAVTVAAQLGTLPLLLYHFHQVSIVFFASALVVVPLAECAIVGAAVLLSLQWCMPLCTIAGRAMLWLLNLQNAIVELLQSPSWASAELWIPLSVCCALVATSTCVIWLPYATNSWKAARAALICLGVALILQLIDNHSSIAEKMIICHGRGDAVVNVTKHGKMTVCCSDSIQTATTVHELELKYHPSDVCWRISRNTAIDVSGSKWLIAQDTLLRFAASEKQIQVDNLVVGRAAGRLKPRKLLSIFCPDTMILLQSYPNYRRQELDSITSAKGIILVKN